MKTAKCKRLLSLLLVMVMLLPMAPMTAEAANTEGEEYYRIVHLDCGRKYFSVASIKKLIDNMAAAGFNQLQLAFGNDGLRFLLDDMSVTANGRTIVDSDTFKSEIRAANKAYHDCGAVNELTQTEMDEIIAYAESRGVKIVPHFDMPGHMNALLKTPTFGGKNHPGSASSINLSNQEAVALAQALLRKYAAYFSGKGCQFFHIGQDEYANDTGNGMGFERLKDEAAYLEFVTFINDCAKIVEDVGMTPRAWNDGIYYGNHTETTPSIDTKIQVTYWSSGWRGYNLAPASTLVSKGFQMINTNGNYYYVLNVDGTVHKPTHPESFSNKNFLGSTVENPVGSMFCIWCDEPGLKTDTEVIEDASKLLQPMATAMEAMGPSKIPLPFPQSAGFPSEMKTGQQKTVSLDKTAEWTCDPAGSISFVPNPSSDTTLTANSAGLAAVTATVKKEVPNSSDVVYQGTVNVTDLLPGEAIPFPQDVNFPSDMLVGQTVEVIFPSAVTSASSDNGILEADLSSTGFKLTAKAAGDVTVTAEKDAVTYGETVHVHASGISGSDIYLFVGESCELNSSTQPSTADTKTANCAYTEHATIEKITKASSVKDGHEYIITRPGTDPNTVKVISSQTGEMGEISFKQGLKLVDNIDPTDLSAAKPYRWIFSSMGEKKYSVEFSERPLHYLNILQENARSGSYNVGVNLSNEAVPIKVTKNKNGTFVFSEAGKKDIFYLYENGTAATGRYTNSEKTQWTLYKYVPASVIGYTATISGVKAGETTAKINGTTYNVHVYDKSAASAEATLIELEVGGADHVITGLPAGTAIDQSVTTNTNISVVTMKPVQASPSDPNVKKVDLNNLVDGQYAISDGKGNFLMADLSNGTDAATATQWTFTKNGEGWTIQSGKKYLNMKRTGITTYKLITAETSCVWNIDGSCIYKRGDVFNWVISNADNNWSSLFVYEELFTGGVLGATQGYPHTVELVTNPNTFDLTFHPIAAGVTWAKVGGTLYKIVVTDPGSVPPPIEKKDLAFSFWCTNAPVTADEPAVAIGDSYDPSYATMNTDKKGLTITSETLAFSQSNGIEIDDFAPPTGTANEHAVAWWQARRLTEGNWQREDGPTSDSKDKTFVGDRFDRIRFNGGKWQIRKINSSFAPQGWADVADTDQLVFYYLQKTHLITDAQNTDITLYSKDWGFDDNEAWSYSTPGSPNNDVCSISFQLVFPNGDLAPVNNNIKERTWFFARWDNRVLGYYQVHIPVSSAYEIYQVSAVSGKAEFGSGSTSNSITMTKNPFANLEILSPDENVLLKCEDGSPRLGTRINDQYIIPLDATENTADPNHLGEGLKWTIDNNAYLVRIYLRSKPVEGSLKVHYVDKLSGDEFYTMPIPVNEGTTFEPDKMDLYKKDLDKDEIDWFSALIKKDPGNLDPPPIVPPTVVNFDNREVGILSDLRGMPEISSKYRYGNPFCDEYELTNGNKDLWLKYILIPNVKNFVDFGIPLEMDIEDLTGGAISNETIGTVKNVELSVPSADASMQFGTYEWHNNSDISQINLIYQPTEPLKGCERFDIIVHFMDPSKNPDMTYYNYIFPASNVMYEESHIMQDDSHGVPWQLTHNKPVNFWQDIKERLRFGFDPFYKDSFNKSSNDTQYSVTVDADHGSAPLITTFYGNACDIIGQCGPDTAMLFISVEDLDHPRDPANPQKTGRVTAVVTRYDDNRYTPDKTLYQVPLAHFDLGYESTWKVTILARYWPAFSDSDVPGTRGIIDGLRVYSNQNNGVFRDLEKNMKYVNVLDCFKNGLAAYVEDAEAAIPEGGYLNRSDYEASGPQNEIYLAKGQSVSLDVGAALAGETIHISARSATGRPQLTIGGSPKKGGLIESNTEMYYEAVVGDDGLITISNSGDAHSLLALGFLKIPQNISPKRMSPARQKASVMMMRRAFMAAPPVMPAEPVKPSEPVTPAEPVKPPVEPVAPAEPVKPAEPAKPVAPAAPMIPFRPEVLEADVKPIKGGSQEFSSMTVKTSTDVHRATINSRPVWPDNLLWVQQGKQGNYSYTAMIPSPSGELIPIDVIVYDKNNVASKAITNTP